MSPATVQMVNEVRSAAERAAALTRQLLAFSRHQVLQPRKLDLNDAVINLAKMLRRIVGEDIDVQLKLRETPVETRADPGMIDQVLMNLVVNARDAMVNGGRLTIETGVDVLTAEAEGGELPLAPGRYARLSVTDTGTGIAPALLPRIFEPFFTTKEMGKGTGLGLATVFGIVKQHGGSISASSTVGHGASFRILLPIWRETEAAPGERAPAAAPLGGSETILLVEDEAMVRQLTRMALERAGYTVQEAPSGAAALDVWHEHRATVRLLMTDLIMPGGVSGRDLAARLQAEDADLRVLYTSGYSAEIAGRDPPLVDGENFVQKPYKLRRLLEIVRRRLDQPPLTPPAGA